MKEGKIVIARIWPRYHGRPYARPGAILGLDSGRFKTICVYLMKNSDKPNFFEENGIKAFYLSNKKFLRVLNLRILYKLVKILKEEKVDIVQCQKHQATVYGTFAAMLTKSPVILAHYEGLGRTRKRRKLINSFILKRVNRILVVAELVGDDVLKHNPVVPPEKVTMLGNCVDFEKYSQSNVSGKQIREREDFPADAFIFGTVGRLAPTKGQISLIRAFSKVKQKLPAAYLVFVGDGSLKEALQAEAKNMGIASSVCFLGYREDIPELLSAMDCFVLPSIAEGLPCVILEAMAAGVPCIASVVGGIPEIITDNKTGFLVPPKDEQALAKKMIDVAEKPEQEIMRIVNTARDLVRSSYSCEKFSKRLENLYKAELQSTFNAKSKEKT